MFNDITNLLNVEKYSDAIKILKYICQQNNIDIDRLESNLDFSVCDKQQIDNLLFKINFIRTELLGNRTDDDSLLTQVCSIFLKRLIERKACLALGIAQQHISQIYADSHLYRKFINQQNKVLNDLNDDYLHQKENLKTLKRLENNLYVGMKLIEDKLHILRKLHPEKTSQINYLMSILGKHINDTGVSTNNANSFNSLIESIHHELTLFHPLKYETIIHFYNNISAFIDEELYYNLLKVNKLETLKLSKIKNWVKTTAKDVCVLSKLLFKTKISHSYHTNSMLSKQLHHQPNNISNNAHINLNNYFFSSPSLFPARKGNNLLSLYSNAYDDKKQTKGLFADICHDIDNAKQNITLTAWALSVADDLSMQDKITLAERLAFAAFRGVKITILMWDIKFLPAHKSDIPEIKQMLDGISDPNILNNIAIKRAPSALGYSEHQKMVIIDSKKLYIGGLDLTHKRANPREWHDTHAAISGPCVRDALKVIDAHWRSIDKSHCFSTSYLNKTQVNNNGNENLKSAIDLAKSIGSKQINTNVDDSTMQLVVGMKHNHFRNNKKWNKTYGVAAHSSELQRAHLEMIANAEHFLYMENQNFSGQYSNLKTSNLVLNAIIEKIVEKYKQGKPFHFYCLLPIYHGRSVKEILPKMLMHRQWQTIKWFIETLNDLTHGNAADYVTFFNTGMQFCNKNEVSYIQKYTHSKLLIADDKELLLGSANITERSLAGNRDSEVMLHLKGQNEKIQDYRVRLLKEHFGEKNLTKNMCYNPECSESVKAFGTILEKNLKLMKNDKSNYSLYATPWGNIPKAHLMDGTRPPIVPAHTPIPAQIAKKIPYTRRLLD